MFRGWSAVVAERCQQNLKQGQHDMALVPAEPENHISCSPLSLSPPDSFLHLFPLS